MKIAGTVKPIYPINSFSNVIFKEGDNEYFLQHIENDRIKCFTPIKIRHDEMISSIAHRNVRIGSNSIHCFLFENNHMLFGSLDELKPRLLKLLSRKCLNPIAKEIICATYLLHGKRLKFIAASNKYFIEKNMNCRLEFDFYSNVANQVLILEEEKVVIEIKKNLKMLKNKNSIKDYSAWIEDDYYIQNYKIKITELFNIIDKGLSKNNLSNICNYFWESLNNGYVNSSVLKCQKTYEYFLTSNFKLDQYQIDEYLSPAVQKYGKTSNVNHSSWMLKSFLIENSFGNLVEKRKTKKASLLLLRELVEETKNNLKKRIND